MIVWNVLTEPWLFGCGTAFKTHRPAGAHLHKIGVPLQSIYGNNSDWLPIKEDPNKADEHISRRWVPFDTIVNFAVIQLKCFVPLFTTPRHLLTLIDTQCCTDGSNNVVRVLSTLLSHRFIDSTLHRLIFVTGQFVARRHLLGGTGTS